MLVEYTRQWWNAICRCNPLDATSRTAKDGEIKNGKENETELPVINRILETLIINGKTIMGNWSGVRIVSTDQYRQNRLKHMAFLLSSQKVKNVRAIVRMGIIHGIRMMIGSVLTGKGGEDGCG